MTLRVTAGFLHGDSNPNGLSKESLSFTQTVMAPSPTVNGCHEPFMNFF